MGGKSKTSGASNWGKWREKNKTKDQQTLALAQRQCGFMASLVKKQQGPVLHRFRTKTTPRHVPEACPAADLSVAPQTPQPKDHKVVEILGLGPECGEPPPAAAAAAAGSVVKQVLRPPPAAVAKALNLRSLAIPASWKSQAQRRAPMKDLC